MIIYDFQPDVSERFKKHNLENTGKLQVNGKVSIVFQFFRNTSTPQAPFLEHCVSAGVQLLLGGPG